MVRLRFMAVALLALAFAGSATQLGRTQQDPFAARSEGLGLAESKPAADDPCVIYSLTDMGYDAVLGTWIADTIPEMIEPNSWKAQGGMGAIRYYAPKNILIVKQTKANQKKVEGFLKDLKSSMPKASAAKAVGKKTPHAGVVVADYRDPAMHGTSHQVSEPSSYPVPAAVKPPKHLFHFIIRYEGDGIIDDNVVKFMKSQLQGAKSPVSVSIPSVTSVPCAPPAPPVAGGAPLPGSYSQGSPNVPPAPDSVPAPAAESAAGPIGFSPPAAEPARPYGTPASTLAPASPSPAPKKRKGKKDEHKERPADTRTITR